MTDASLSPESVSERPKSVWPFALLALLISFAWAAGYVITNIAEMPRPDGTPEGDANAIGYWLGSTLPPAVLTWVAFHFIVFRKRGSTAKSLFVLALMAVVTPGLVITSLLGLISAARSGQAVERQIAATTEANIRVLNERLQADIAALQMPQDPFQGIRTGADVDAALERVRRARTLFADYSAAVNAELAAAEQRVNSADLSPAQKQRAVNAINAETGPDSRMRRSFVLTTAVMESNEALLVFLRDHRSHWVEQNGQFMFDDQAVLNEFNALTQRHDELGRELLALREEADAAAPLHQP